LCDAGVSFSALCVVNRANASHPRKVYRFLAEQLGAWRIQFNPAVEHNGEPGLNYLCSGLYRFHDHFGPDVVQILKRLDSL